MCMSVCGAFKKTSVRVLLPSITVCKKLAVWQKLFQTHVIISHIIIVIIICIRVFNVNVIKMFVVVTHMLYI